MDETTDFNDSDTVDLGGAEPVDLYIIPPARELRITANELAAAQITPACIVADYLYADVALVAGQGGTGKTTVILCEAVHIRLGLPLYGLEIRKPGPVLIVTAEDRRELLIARLRRIMEALDLTAAQRATVCDGVMVWDVSGTVCRLAELDAAGNVTLTGLADAIVEWFGAEPPVLVALDPCISFGAGERLTNDNEHALILAARRIVRGLGCCVRLICHTGKENARSGTMDQYASRGGSALSDGARMVTVLRSWSPDADDKLSPPPGFTVGLDEQVIVLARAKLSYAPQQPIIWLTRRGYAFQHAIATRTDPEAEARARADQIETYLIEQLKADRRYTQNTLQDMDLMKRKDLRVALATLQASGRVFLAPLPKAERQGSRQAYLHPATAPDSQADLGAVGAKEGALTAPPDRVSTTAPAYRKLEFGAVVSADSISTFPQLRRNDSAQFGAVGAVGGSDGDNELVEVEV